MIDFACQQFDLNEIVKCSLGLTKADFRMLGYFLNEDENWFTTHELAKSLKLNLSTIQRCVKSLHEKDVLERAQENLNGGGYTFIYKIKNRTELRKKIKYIIHKWVKKVDVELEKW